MRALSTAALLDVWERGLGQTLCQRALMLLAAASPEAAPEQLARLTVGVRDARLLTLRELTFGSSVTGVAHCSVCSTRLELTFSAEQARVTSHAAEDADISGSEPLSLKRGGCEIHFRLPDSVDLAAIAQLRNIAGARDVLLRRCITGAWSDGVETSIDQVPSELLESAVERMAQADPQADVQVTFSCPTCGQRREVAFDIASFLWSELEICARRVLRDVHALASTYGWRETDILAMSSRRRQLYLELIGA